MNVKQNAKALIMVVIAAVTLETTGILQYHYSRKGIKAEASMKAESQLDATLNKIMDVVNQTEAAVRNNVWIAQWCLDCTDSLHRVCQRVVTENPVVMGSTVALVPGYNASKPLLAPYVCRNQDGLQYLSLATPEYDYPAQEWFVKPLELGCGYWSEPYVDEGGGEILMTTFSLPVHDMKGQVAAVITADISLEWLSELIGNTKVYPHAYCSVKSRGGKMIVSPPDDFSFEKTFVYEAPVDRTGWSMSMVIPERDMFSGLRRIGGLVIVLQLIGMIMIIVMLRSFIVEQIRYTDLDRKRARLFGELQIASNIQMSMIPKVFPPFPERHDLDIAATIVPAKEVGGDLYDFFIRNEKLFFCVGDVSGKGVPASLVMAVTRTTFRNLSARENSPGKIVRAMNDSLSAMNENNMFVTFFCGVLDLQAGVLQYCNAGHNPPMILTNNIKPLPVEPNLPLGILSGADFIEQETPFRYDDALFLYTDGLTEAEDSNHEQFGEERMKKALHGRKSAEKHLENIKRKVTGFVGDAPQSDDLTLLFIHYLPAVRRLTLRNDISQIELLPDFVEDAVKASKLNLNMAGSLNLAIEEAVTNVILYAWPEGTEGHVSIEAVAGNHALTFTISDNGKAFDPTAKKEVDISAGVEERPIGGLGIHLIRNIMDEVHYERDGENNILTLTKNY